MNPSRIENAIEEIYDYVESCKPSKLYPNKVTVSKDELYDLVDALRMCEPEEIKRYQKIINNRDEILRDAETKAKVIIEQAQEQTKQFLDQNELVQAAYAQADQIIQSAQAQAEQIVQQAVEESEQVRTSALYYTGDLLGDAGKNIENALHDFENKSTMLLSVLRQSVEVIQDNRAELKAQIEGTLDEEPSDDATSQELEVQEESTEQ